MEAETMQYVGAGVLLMLLLVLSSFFITYLMVKLVHVLSVHKIKRTLKKYNLEEYDIIDTRKGVPSTLQKKSNRNEIIYL